MGNSKFLDALNKEQYAVLTKKLWEIQNHKCFICEKDIDLDIQSTNIDHIRPLANGGKDEEINFALTHEYCNKSKQDADLVVAKRLMKLADIISQAELAKETPSLKHVLASFGGSKHDFKYKIEGKYIKYCFESEGRTDIQTSEVFTDALSGEKTAFISVPLSYLYHDEIINPRGINSTISLLIKEFHKPNPQLHLSLARLDSGRIKIFDGQHKAVAQIMLGIKEIVVRLFINPDVDRLIETNTIAGSKLKQIAFDKAIVRQLHDTMYSERLKQYQIDHHLAEDDFSFSEQNLVDHFRGERGNVKLYIINSQKNAVTRSPESKLQSYINFEGRGTTLPLSYSTFEKTFLSAFISTQTILSKPINYRLDEGLNPRVLEKEQLIMLCNIMRYAEGLLCVYENTLFEENGKKFLLFHEQCSDEKTVVNIAKSNNEKHFSVEGDGVVKIYVPEYSKCDRKVVDGFVSAFQGEEVTLTDIKSTKKLSGLKVDMCGDEVLLKDEEGEAGNWQNCLSMTEEEAGKKVWRV